MHILLNTHINAEYYPLHFCLATQSSPLQTWCDNNVLSCDRHLENKKTFTSSAGYQPISSQLRGTRSLQQFRDVQERDERTQELLQCGLSQEEAKIKLQGADTDGEVIQTRCRQL